MTLVDGYGRTIRNLRVSLTDKCDMRCLYCMPEAGAHLLTNREILSFDEIERVVRIAAGLGVRKVRLTGGEPLVRPGVPEVVARIRAVEGIEDIGLTTNGVRLKELAAPLYEAGLRRVNVSMDSLDRETFRRITRSDSLERVWEGLAEAERVGFRPIKINVVAMRGSTEAEVLRFAELARRKPYQVRFIEFMPLDGGGVWGPDSVLPGRAIVEQIHARWPLVPLSRNGHSDPATLYRFADGQGEVGIIPTVTEPFCDHCTRIRLTADGKLRTCLFATEETDLRELLRGGAPDVEIAEAIRGAVARKGPGHRINTPEFRQPNRVMFSIGG